MSQRKPNKRYLIPIESSSRMVAVVAEFIHGGGCEGFKESSVVKFTPRRPIDLAIDDSFRSKPVLEQFETIDVTMVKIVNPVVSLHPYWAYRFLFQDGGSFIYDDATNRYFEGTT